MSPRTIGTGVLLGSYVAGSPEWQKARLGRLGASEIAAVLGLSKWQSPFSLWHLKAANIPPEPDNRAMEWGRDQEWVIARRFVREHPDWKVSRCGLYVNRDRDYQVAEPDRVLHLGGRKLASLEVKTDRYADDWGAEGTDDIPIYYKVQAMWQMDCFGWSECYFAVLITGVDYREFLVRYDAEEAELMRAAAVDFLASIEAGTPPSIDEHAATYRAVRQLHPDIVDLDVEIDEVLAKEYKAALADVDAAEGAKSRASSRVIDAMGRARRAVCNKERIAIRVPTKGGPPHLRPAGNGRKRAAA
ncbi:MAG: YqaJ viral recombinase family protein [Pseudonocardiaceae bacterium]